MKVRRRPHPRQGRRLPLLKEGDEPGQRPQGLQLALHARPRGHPRPPLVVRLRHLLRRRPGMIHSAP